MFDGLRENRVQLVLMTKELFLKFFGVCCSSWQVNGMIQEIVKRNRRTTLLFYLIIRTQLYGIEVQSLSSGGHSTRSEMVIQSLRQNTLRTEYRLDRVGRNLGRS